MTPHMEFHISRHTRDHYQFQDSLFSLSGNVIFANFHATRAFAQKMNEKRDLVNFPEQTVKAGQLGAMGLIDEILHFVVSLYHQQRNPQAMQQALQWLEQKLGREAVDKMLHTFVDEFPTVAVYRQHTSGDEYLRDETDGIPNRQIALEEMLMLWLANANPAFSPFLELFDDSRLEHETDYARMAIELREFFETQPKFGPEQQNLIDMLCSPARTSPHSLVGQLEFISTHWSSLLGRYLYRLLANLDLIKEENRPSFFGPGPAQLPVLDFAALGYPDVEKYSADRDWMPRLVLLAKNAFVWLDQLSKTYQRPITRLDLIPDEELDRLARWGFTGLWLIGIWERSPASQHIKQLTGNPEALPSAYSLYDYRIAADLGGENACQNLRERAMRRGIRLASDMVPNHMGIDSPWVVEHPDWFISLDYSPFPSYTFSGPDLTRDSRVGIFAEDHYYTRTDAAVVFKRVDYQNGSERYLYHGNDGTSMPWNDTAQLNYLNPQVREAVIQTILHVARQFPIIRFDAAMTLTKRHYQRLWFPEPGSGGAIPSRAGLGLTREQFDHAMPGEFWRDLVDRAAQDAPDTLLLAEAFWMMEGYFVRTLGMHRVYNSAFMNMLRDEDNAKYRVLIKSTLEFDPQILKRYVNFMNNPDERTAVDQFGKGDKYFGICTLMATLPGLPMVGHGQIEGFTEKYGMEFRHAHWDEQADTRLIERHEQEIFPLLHRRYLFAGVENFLLYDFFTPEGIVNEDVFAFSNRFGQEKALVVYHNKFASTKGWLRDSAAFVVKSIDGERALKQDNLGKGLALTSDANLYAIFRDQVNGLEYIRSNQELCEKGLYVELDAYQRHVFLDFRAVVDDATQRYSQLANYLNGRGVPSIEEAMRELLLQPLTQPFRALVNVNTLLSLCAARVTNESAQVDVVLLDDAQQKMLQLLRAIKEFTGSQANEEELAAVLRRELEFMLQPPFPPTFARGSAPAYDDSPQSSLKVTAALRYLRDNQLTDTISAATGFVWVFIHALGRLVDHESNSYENLSRSWIDEWKLGQIIADALRDLGADELKAAQSVVLLKTLTTHQNWIALRVPESQPTVITQIRHDADTASSVPKLKSDEVVAHARQLLQLLLADADAQWYLKINRYRDILWFNKEAFEQLLWWLMVVATVSTSATAEDSLDQTASMLHNCYQIVEILLNAEAQSGYQVEKLVSGVHN